MTAIQSDAMWQRCAYCGFLGHREPACPRVSAIDYHDNGTIKRVEFSQPSPVQLQAGSFTSFSVDLDTNTLAALADSGRLASVPGFLDHPSDAEDNWTPAGSPINPRTDDRHAAVAAADIGHDPGRASGDDTAR